MNPSSKWAEVGHSGNVVAYHVDLPRRIRGSNGGLISNPERRSAEELRELGFWPISHTGTVTSNEILEVAVAVDATAKTVTLNWRPSRSAALDQLRQAKIYELAQAYQDQLSRGVEYQGQVWSLSADALASYHQKAIQAILGLSVLLRTARQDSLWLSAAQFQSMFKHLIEAANTFEQNYLQAVAAAKAADADDLAKLNL